MRSVEAPMKRFLIPIAGLVALALLALLGLGLIAQRLIGQALTPVSALVELVQALLPLIELLVLRGLLIQVL
jgi:hypothetical protein